MLQVKPWKKMESKRSSKPVLLKAYDEKADIIYSRYSKSDKINCICRIKENCVEIVEIM